MVIGIRQQTGRQTTDGSSVSFMGKSLKPVDSAKDLGVTLDGHLNYDNHISQPIRISYANKILKNNNINNC